MRIPLMLAMSLLTGCTVILQGGAVTGSAPAGLSSSAPMRCEANQRQELTNAWISGAGPAVVASGNCELTITSSTLDVSGVAIVVQDNAVVTIRNSRVSGSEGSYSLSNNGALHTSGTSYVGRRGTADNAEATDEGGNTYRD